jgi:lysylphosphatidylglycerol synthetase-like protein (DUF2156 family)
MKGLSWANFILGLWLIVAPFVLHYNDISTAMWNNVIVGIVIAVLAIYRALEKSNIQPLQHHAAH